ncbi:MAG: serpin family protein [Planctomycetia bacterium]|nr:serpin family protein [Planctomycetia bacterium]
MFRSRALWLLGLALLALSVGACVAPVTPTPEPLPEPVPEPEEPPPSAPAEDLKALAEGNNAFAIDLYKKLAETEQGNIVISPYSIRTALGMTYAGARGQTAEEMKKVLHFTLPDEKLHSAFGATAHQLTGGKDKPYKLNVANALWGQKGFPFRPEFLELNRKNYAGGFRQVDFAGDPEGSRQTINRWVEEKTQDKIKELLKQDAISPATRLVLTNAIYMNATWAVPFPKSLTKDENFEPAPGVAVKVPLMRHAHGEFRISKTPDLHLLELPYHGELSMLVVLPVKRWGLRDVEKTLTAPMLRDLTINLRYGIQREVVLPRFTTRSRFDLPDTLKALGMQQAFGAADFSGINPGGGLSIANVIHEGVIEVDEVGTVAAAATAVDISTSYTQFDFRADQPFMFLIVDRRTGAVLFLGRCANPV